VPQLPQFTFVVSGASHPLATTPSQLPKPALQLAMAHVPDPHVAVAFVSGPHPTPHEPQLVAVFSGVSQSCPVPEQWPKPGLQLATAQVPLPHVAVPFMVVHALPHAPQLTFVFSGDSQPLLGLPSQSPKPALQLTIAHVPVEHVEAALARLHAVPHPPQLASVLSGVSQSCPTALQCPKPALQLVIAHVPVPQLAVPFITVHAVPHPPQFVSVSSGMQPAPQFA
jgi:hypothetical protein